MKIDTVHNLLYLKGCIPGFDNAFIRIRDAVRAGWYGKTFPQGAKVPFPTMIRQPGVKVPRELVPPMPQEDATDPFSRQLREKNS